MKTGTIRAAMLATFSRDLTLAYRAKGELLNPLMFFLMVSSLFPLAVSPDPTVLGNIAAGIIWVGALLATLLSLDLLFKADHDDGTLEQFLLMPQPMVFLVLAKIIAHWFIAGLPLVIVAPLLGVMLGLPQDAYFALFISLLLGTPILSLLGAIGAGLTVGLKKGGMLLPLLILPLYIPVLIFGASAVQTAGQGMAINGHIAFLGAYLFFTLAVCPLATVAALKLSVAR
jgi:heme exporter protein B